jgi:hypothetical protein
MFQNCEVDIFQPEGHEFDFRIGHGFFSLPNTSSCTMALGPTQPLPEMSSITFFGVKGDRCYLRADYLENVEPSTYHKLMAFHCLVQGQFLYQIAGNIFIGSW